MYCTILKKYFQDTQLHSGNFILFEKKFFERNIHISNFVSNQNEK